MRRVVLLIDRKDRDTHHLFDLYKSKGSAPVEAPVQGQRFAAWQRSGPFGSTDRTCGGTREP